MNYRKGAIPLAVFAVAFFFIYAIETSYERHRIFAQYNTLFDADPNLYLEAFGSGWGAISFRHPFGGVPFALPIRALSKVLSMAGVLDDQALRVRLALLVSPLSGALKTVLIYLMLSRLGVSALSAVALCALSLVSLSSVTVGSVPESFPLSSLFITLFAFLMVVDHTSAKATPLWKWILAGSAAVGITLTNLVPFLTFFFLGRFASRKSWIHPGLLQTARVGASSLVLAVIVAIGGCVVVSASPRLLLPANDNYSETRHSSRNAVREFGVAAVSTVAGVIRPQFGENEHYTKPLERIQRSRDSASEEKPALLFMLTYAKSGFDDPVSLAWGALFALLLAAGALLAFRRSDAWRSLVLGSMGLLAFNFAMHQLFFGRDIFLYAPHWQPLMLFLLAGLAFAGGRRLYGTVIVSALLAVSAYTAFQTHSEIMRAAERELKAAIRSPRA